MTPDRDPDLGLTAEEAKRVLNYPAYRAWWAAYVVGRPYRKTWRTRAVRPPPGTVDAPAEPEE